jgi:hypothetical protein
MKKLILFSVIFCLLFSCKKSPEKNDTPGCYTLTQIDGWPKINFKSNYTIQVPDGFDGLGMAGFEGNTFAKHSSDNKINLTYAYCDNGLFCFDFGDTLSHPAPGNIQILNNLGSSVTTNKIKYFCQNSDTVGLLYYIGNYDANGRLYWKDNNIFKAALDVDFLLTEMVTVDKIIGTIKVK